ncbi:hypothetical protein CRG98_048450 [Punica granatum]|uniref:Uncharacterized protein n=1 Tax=Punica granatum TaxID=22663 RepID=A0A2I0HHJ2_PUNGR|nr:hypothetical protein CRG98_048450 [Punica granatum]
MTGGKDGRKLIVIEILLVDQKEVDGWSDMEWAKLFQGAGFSKYGIAPLVGPRCLIEGDHGARYHWQGRVSTDERSARTLVIDFHAISLLWFEFKLSAMNSDEIQELRLGRRSDWTRILPHALLSCLRCPSVWVRQIDGSDPSDGFARAGRTHRWCSQAALLRSHGIIEGLD